MQHLDIWVGTKGLESPPSAHKKRKKKKKGIDLGLTILSSFLLIPKKKKKKNFKLFLAYNFPCTQILHLPNIISLLKSKFRWILRVAFAF